jgi:fused signal recognition particle receptor
MRFGFVKSLFQKVDTLLTGRGRIDDDLLEELEEALLQADVNVRTTQTVLDDLRQAVREDRLKSPDDVRARLKTGLREALDRAVTASSDLVVGPEPPTLYLFVGVNGVGKTTTIGKLGHRLKQQGKSVLLAAGDTFRAAAIDQLRIWGERIGAEVIRHREGADPSAVIFDAIQAARARGVDYVLADTAGRLHTRSNLMQELKKVSRVAATALGRPPDETLLVLDATTGQNAIEQARQFSEVAGLSGLVLAKLDGTARGGIVLTIAQEFHLPIKLVGTGERVDAIEPFEANAFLDALLA